MPSVSVKDMESFVLRAARAWARMKIYGTSLEDGLIVQHSPTDAEALAKHMLGMLQSESVLYLQRVGDTLDQP